MKSSEHAIGDVAAQFGLATSVLRHWEDVGLVRPQRDAAGRRRYGPAEITRIAIVQRSKLAGLSLDQIAVLLDRDAPDRHRILQEHLAEIERRIDEMHRWQQITQHAFDCHEHDLGQCPNLQRQVADLLGAL